MPKEKAPHLVAAGISPRKLREQNRPRQAPPPPPPPVVPPEKYVQAYEGVRRGLPDADIVRVYTVPLDVVKAVRAEVEALRAKLAGQAPVAWDAVEPAVEGDPEYVPPEPEPAPEPPVDPGMN